MKQRTIIAAAIAVLKKIGCPMSASEIFEQIMKEDLYEFHAQNPLSVLRGELRCHSVGLDFPSASLKKYFVYNESTGKFDLCSRSRCLDVIPSNSRALSLLDLLKNSHDEYIKDFRRNILQQLKILTPYDFEAFCKNLLKKYGFFDVAITQKSRDGGIDGYGNLKIGLANMSVAFQCKRWNVGKVGRKEIDAFRGAIQGEYEQGIFFTTSYFTKEAMGYSIKKGAVPIILIDGSAIVNFMLENHFGIEQENLPIYLNALDKVL